MAGSEFESADEPASEVTNSKSFVPPITLPDVFRELEERQQNCIDMEGDGID
jgi:hypothetical protein